MTFRFSFLLLAMLASAGSQSLAAASAASAAPNGATGAVFTASNEATGNNVLAFRRDASGALSFLDAYPTGGLGNQGGLVLDRAGRHLFVVNAGSDTVSVFALAPGGLELLDVEPTGGIQPISVTTHGDLVYVVHSGGDGEIRGLRFDGSALEPLPGSMRPLGAPAPGPAQISFTPDGNRLVVTEKGTNSIVTYAIDSAGLPGDPVVSAAAGLTPFGFSFGHRSQLLVSEAAGGAAGASTVSSYEIAGDGTVSPITAALATTQSAACWLVVSPDGRHAYVTNTQSATLTGLSVAPDGFLELLDPDGASAPTGTAPIDAARSRDGRFLYVLNAGDDTIRGYAIGVQGALKPLATTGALAPSVNGLAAL